MHFTGIEQQTKPVRPTPKPGSCSVKVIPRGINNRMDEIKRKPWDSTPYIQHSGFSRRTVCKDIMLSVPTPDFTCTPVKQVKHLSNGDIQEREVCLCQENWKPAPWACGPQNVVHMRQCHKWGAGISQTGVTPLPNNYRILYCIGSDPTEDEGVYCRPVVCEINNDATSEDSECIVDAACYPAASGIHRVCSCCISPHLRRDCDCTTECSR